MNIGFSEWEDSVFALMIYLVLDQMLRSGISTVAQVHPDQ